MNENQFSLQDGNVTANVHGKPENNSITIHFDITDSRQAKPVIDMYKYESILAHYKTIRSLFEQTSSSATVSELDLVRGGRIEFNACFNAAGEYTAALEALRSLHLQPVVSVMETHTSSIAEDNLTQLEKIRIQYEDHPEDMPEVAPEIHRQNSKTQSINQRLMQVEAAAELRHTLKVWKLDGEVSGMNASVFPLDQSIVTGKAADEKTKLVAIRITPGIDTKNARAVIYHNTHEVEKRLLFRGLPLVSADIYLGTEPDGHRDTGVIIIKAGKNPLETLGQVNNVLEQVQEEYDVLRLKLGTRYRGADHYNRKVTPLPERQPLDNVAAQLFARLHSAMEDGLLTLNGTTDDLAAWVRTTALEIRKGQEPPKRAMGY